MTKITLAVALAAQAGLPRIVPVAPRPLTPLSGVWTQLTAIPVVSARVVPAVPRAESAVPGWFDASGLAYAYLRADANGFAVVILRRGRNELAVYMDPSGDQAVFTRYALNPMGTPEKEEVALRSAAARRAVADILRRAPAPATERERAVLEAVLAALS